jgi:hypothetical protein
MTKVKGLVNAGVNAFEGLRLQRLSRRINVRRDERVVVVASW